MRNLLSLQSPSKSEASLAVYNMYSTWLFHAFLYPSLPLQMYNRVWMDTQQWPARARGRESSNTSMANGSHVIVSSLNRTMYFTHKLITKLGQTEINI